jgi:HSP20 family protein
MVNITKKNDENEERGIARVTPVSLIDRFFDDDFFDPWSMRMPGLFPMRRLASMSTAFPKVDVTETDKEIRVVANVPGIDPDKINVEVGDDYLSLSGKAEKETKEEDKKGKVYRYEREYGEFCREFTLPSRVDKDKIVAKTKNGVLTLTLPKISDKKTKMIKVESE